MYNTLCFIIICCYFIWGGGGGGAGKFHCSGETFNFKVRRNFTNTFCSFQSFVEGNCFFKMLIVLCTLYIHINIIPIQQKIHVI